MEQGKSSLGVLPRIPGRGGPWDQESARETAVRRELQKVTSERWV